jgi:hypothetical protein
MSAVVARTEMNPLESRAVKAGFWLAGIVFAVGNPVLGFPWEGCVH